MENVLIIEETEDTPKVIFDRTHNNFEISGRSLPEDAATFFTPIHQWLSEYVQSPNDETIFNLKLEYFNSSSAKQIMEVLIRLEKISETGKSIVIKWFYNIVDELMESRGKEIKSLVDIPFELITYQ